MLTELSIPIGLPKARTSSPCSRSLELPKGKSFRQLRFNFQKREIEQAIHADKLCLQNGTLPLGYTIYFDANGACPRYYVRIGHDVPVGGDDHTRACAALSGKNAGLSMLR